MVTLAANRRVISGMRPTGLLHLGHYHGVLRNWLELQHEYECFFFVADWQALVSEYASPGAIAEFAREMVIDWLAVGINPGQATLFAQSRVPEHAELHLLLSMITPLGWLERVPGFKERQGGGDLSSYGHLGYPLLQSADVLLYRAGLVPVGEDQIAHIELARELARRFNHLYGREPEFEHKAAGAARRMGKRNAELYFDLRRRYQEEGDVQALEKGRAFLEAQQNVSLGDRERLLGYLEGSGKIILPEPRPVTSPHPRIAGLDGQRMSKAGAGANAIALRESPESVERKLRTMPTDPARIRRTDPGEPERCPVWSMHRVYSEQRVQDWAEQGCRTAGIGCLECKGPLIEAVLAEQAPIRERAAEFQTDPQAVRNILNEGCEAAREVARETLDDVREVMGLAYR